MSDNKWWVGGRVDSLPSCGCSMGRSLVDLRAEYESLPDGPDKETARIRHDGALLRTKTAAQVLIELRALPRCDPPSPQQYELARQYYLLRDCEEILKDVPKNAGAL